MKTFSLFISLILISVGIYFSTFNAEFNLIIEGFVVDDVTPIYRTNVLVDKRNGKPLSDLYYEPTSETGGYRLQFNAVDKHYINLIYKKNGYLEHHHKYFPEINKKKDKVKDIFLFDIRNDQLNSNEYRGSFGKSQMLLFSDTMSISPPDTLFYKQIDFLNHTEKRQKGWYRINLVMKNEAIRRGWVNYQKPLKVLRP